MANIRKASTYLVALTITLVCVDITIAGKIPLTFSLIVSYGRYGFNSSGNIPAIDLALEHINSSGVLGNYKLQYSTVKNSEVILFMTIGVVYGYHCSCIVFMHLSFHNIALSTIDIIAVSVEGSCILLLGY